MKDFYTTPQCVEYELSPEASMCVTASLEGFSKTDENIDLFNPNY